MGTAEQTEHCLSWLGRETVVEAVREGLSFMVSFLRYPTFAQNGGFEIVYNFSGLPDSSWITDGKVELLS